MSKGSLFKWFGTAAGILTLAAPLWAADYSSYSTEDLAAMRGTLSKASAEERNAFRTEWQKRMRNMTQDQRMKYGTNYGHSAGASRGFGCAGCRRNR